MNIISIIVCVFYLVFLLFYLRKMKLTVLDHRLVIVLLFTIMQIGVSFRLFDTIRCRDEIFIMCLLAITFYLLGSNAAKHVKFGFKGIGYDGIKHIEINYYAVYFLIIVSILIMMPFMLNIQNILVSNSLKEGLLSVRRMAGSGEGAVYSGVSQSIIYLFGWIVEPVCFALPPIVACDMLYGKQNKMIMIGTILIVVMKTLFAINRATLFYTVIMIAIIFWMNGKRIKLTKKQKRTIILISIALLGGVFYISSIRAFQAIGQSIYIYLVAALQNLDVRLDEITQSDMYTLGIASFNGFINQPISILKAILDFDYGKWYKNVDEILSSVEIFKSIGGDIEMNAFVTPIWYLYLDGRYFGICIGMMVYGFFVEKGRLACCKNHNVRTDSIYALLLLGVLFSMVRIQFASYAYAFGLVLIIVLTRVKRE